MRFALLAVVLMPALALAEAILPAVFGSHMVLQSGRPLPIWGAADPGEAVIIEFADQHVETEADTKGHWRVTLDELAPSPEPREFIVKAGNLIRLSDVLVGEVWFCAGQSNMEWPLVKSATGEAELAAADHRHIRLHYRRGAARGGSGKYTPEHLSRMAPAKFCEGEWQLCTSDTAKEFSAVAYFFGRHLHENLNVPVGLICSAIGGTPAESWISREGLASLSETAPLVHGDWLENERLSDWCQQRAEFNFSRARAAREEIPGDDLGPHHSFKPTFMYQAGVAPIIPFAIRGAIWYQGESNAEDPQRVAQHELLFPLLVNQWRKDWAQGNFPFVYVQLPALGRPDWPTFRDQQRRFLDRLNNVGMAITMDVGHSTNVHPTNKRPVGERLANWALARTYGQDAMVASGPLVRSGHVRDGELHVQFDYASGGLATSDGEPPRHFEVSDEQGVWHQVAAKILGDQIVADISDQQQPISVRYGWQPYPDPPLNLVNSSQTPASPFAISVTPPQDDY